MSDDSTSDVSDAAAAARLTLDITHDILTSPHSGSIGKRSAGGRGGLRLRPLRANRRCRWRARRVARDDLGGRRRCEGVLFDQGSVVAEAQSKLDGSPVRSRIQFIGGDFFEQIPPGGDAYVLSRILHDWDDDNVAHILTRCRAAMDVDARLLIAECVLPQDAKDNPGAIWMDVLMLLLLRSRERL